MKTIYAFGIWIVCLLFLGAQENNHTKSENHDMNMTQVEGHVYFQFEEENTPLANIRVYWKEMPSMETVTDLNGHFVLAYHEGLYTIVAEEDGFTNMEYLFQNQDKIEIFLEFEDQEELSGLEVKSRLESLSIDSKSAGLMFQISDEEILKAACCNLSESFETNPSVDVSYNDAVTGTKEILLLGLNQKYTAYSKDNLNEIKGLASYDGLEFFPGRWIQSIQLVKGTPSATTTFDGITGMINTNLYQYKDKPITKVNAYFNQNARAEVNVVSTQKLNEKWSNATLLHGSSRFNKVDRNKDGFLDTPLSTNFNLANVLRYNDLTGKGWNSFIGFQLMNLEKIGGQKDYQSQRDRLTNHYYGVESDTKRFTLWNKLGKMLPKKGSSIGFLQQFSYHNQEQSFGELPYNGKETSYEAKILYDDFIGNTNHKITLGSNFMYDKFEEEYNYTAYNREETDVGVFGEYQYSYTEKIKLLLGARVDFHNLAGTQFLPRIHFKYSPKRNTDFRISAGRSFRTANIWEESQKYRVSQREFRVIHSANGQVYGLDPEEAWNFGASITQGFRLFHRKSTISVDYFRTEFQNQVVSDVDFDSRMLLFYNVKGGSNYNSLQALLTTSPVNNLEVRLAYKYYQTKIDYFNQSLEAPYVPKNRGFLNLGYNTSLKDGKKWSFDTTLQYTGTMRLPNTQDNPAEFRRSEHSDSFWTLNGQIARDFSEHLRLYIGAENITSYTQDNPIIEADNPFGEYFDASFVYAPIMPVNVYFGLDFNF